MKIQPTWPKCEYCHKANEDLELVQITKHVSVLICYKCYKIITQVSRYPHIALRLCNEIKDA